jgi:hypothetical protein
VTAIHILLHLTIPATVARLAYADMWIKAWLLMMTAMLIDLDHLIASPIFDPNRCSIGFHPLHTVPAILVYTLCIFVPRLRLIAIGALIHIGVAASDCLRMAL